MRRFLKYFLCASAVAALLVIVVVALFFIPAVQKFVLVRALSGPDGEVSVEDVRIRPGSAVISGFSLTTPEARIRFEHLDSRFRLGPLLFDRTLSIQSLTVSEILVETEEKEDPPEIDFWEEFEGLLIDPPLDFHVHSMKIDGVFRSPAGTAVTFILNGRDLSSRDNDGLIEVTLDVEDENIPGNGRVFAAIEVRPEFDSDGVFQQLSADLSLSESPEEAPLVRSEFGAIRTLAGEDYQVMVYASTGRRTDHVVVAAIGEWSRENRRARGAVNIDFARDMLPIETGFDPMPDFSLRGQTEILVSEAGGIELKSENTARIREFAALYGMPEELDELTINASLDINISDTHLSLAALDIGIAERPGIDLVRIHAPSPLEIGFAGDGDWTFPDLDDPLLVIDLPGIPPELVNLFLGDLRLSADPITARFALLARNGRFELETEAPLSFQRLTLSGPDGILLDESNIGLNPSGFLSASAFEFNLGIDASLPQARSLAIEVHSSGALPPANSTLLLEVQADGLPSEAPVSDFTLSGSLSTTHASGSALPDSAEFHLMTEGTPRPGAYDQLPHRVDLLGEVSRTSDRLAYELNVTLPETNGAETPPLISTQGAFTPDGSRIEGVARFGLPDRWARNLAESADGLHAIDASGDVTYGGGLTPLAIEINSSTFLTVDTGRTELPGNGRISLITEAAIRLGDFIELDSFHAAVSPEGSDLLLRADLLQPVSLREGAKAFDALPEGDLFEIEVGQLRVEEWIPEAQRNGFSGGRIRGGIRLSRSGDEIHLRPTGERIEIAELRLDSPEGRAIPALTLTLVPFAQIDESSASFGLESLILSTDEQPLLEASFSGDLPAIDSNDAPRLATGTFALNGDLASVNSILGDDAFPNLRDGAFDIDVGMTIDPEKFLASWTGTLVIPALRATTQDTAYAINAEFSGEASETMAQGRVLGGIDDGSVLQELELTFEVDPNPEGRLPLVEVRGESDFLDLLRLENLAAIFSRDPEPEVVPDDDPAPIETLLPVDLQAEFNIARMKVLPDFDLRDVRIDVAGDDQTIAVRQARIRFLDEAEIEIAGTLSTNEGNLRFASTGQGANIDIADLLRHTREVAEPDIEGVFSFDYEGSSQGPDPAALLRRLDAVLNLNGERGRLRLTVPDQRMERIRQLAGMQEGAIGSAIARITGAPPGIRALAESVNLLTNIPYDSIEVRLGMTEGRTLIVERLDLTGPYLYAGGTGRLDDFDPEAIEDTRLDIRVEIGAAGALREQFRILRLLSDQNNALGYQMLRQRPVAVTGTVGEPNLREVWDLLIQAGAGAATARETPDGERGRDPVEDAVEGIRGILGW